MIMKNVRRIPRRGLPAGAAALVAVAVSAGVAVATSGVHEIDTANATMRIAPAPKFSSTACAGPDGMRYVTFRGGCHGAEIDVTPGSTDYSLKGVLTVSKVTWTVNLKTRHGAQIGAAVLTDPAGARTYAGNAAADHLGTADSEPAGGRPWLRRRRDLHQRRRRPRVVTRQRRMRISSGFSATGQFGDSASTLNTPNYSVTTANQVC
jgi:hypothetical protein